MLGIPQSSTAWPKCEEERLGFGVPCSSFTVPYSYLGDPPLYTPCHCPTWVDSSDQAESCPIPLQGTDFRGHFWPCGTCLETCLGMGWLYLDSQNSRSLALRPISQHSPANAPTFWWEYYLYLLCTVVIQPPFPILDCAGALLTASRIQVGCRVPSASGLPEVVCFSFCFSFSLFHLYYCETKAMYRNAPVSSVPSGSAGLVCLYPSQLPETSLCRPLRRRHTCVSLFGHTGKPGTRPRS